MHTRGRESSMYKYIHNVSLVLAESILITEMVVIGWKYEFEGNSESF